MACFLIFLFSVTPHSSTKWHFVSDGMLNLSTVKHILYINAYVTHTHPRLMALCLKLPRWAGTRKVKPIWILLKQETVNGNWISWAICKSAPRSRQITTPAPHHSVFYRPGALPATQPTASKHWRQTKTEYAHKITTQKITLTTKLVLVKNT